MRAIRSGILFDLSRVGVDTRGVRILSLMVAFLHARSAICWYPALPQAKRAPGMRSSQCHMKE
jgi:hypothetical protein